MEPLGLSVLQVEIDLVTAELSDQRPRRLTRASGTGALRIDEQDPAPCREVAAWGSARRARSCLPVPTTFAGRCRSALLCDAGRFANPGTVHAVFDQGSPRRVSVAEPILPMCDRA